MTTQLQIGTASDVVSTATGVAGLILSVIQKQRLDRAEVWPSLLAELSDLTEQEIQRVLEDNPVITELVGRAWLSAAEATADEKRILLARVAAQALRYPDDLPRINELVFLERAIAALDPPDVKLLTLIGSPTSINSSLAQTVQEGFWTEVDLSEQWSGATEFLRPMLATLESHGLIEDRGRGTYNGTTGWGLAPFGRRFITFLRDEEDAPATTASLALRIENPGAPEFPHLVVRNLGPGVASAINLSTPTRRSDGGSILTDGEPVEAFYLGPEQERGFKLWPFTATDRPPYHVTARWTDMTGEHEVARELYDRLVQ